MTDQELDRILSGVRDIVPSSGFVRSVMDAVRLEAVMPPPISVPWEWVVPGLAAWAIALAVVVWMSFDQFARPASMPRAISSIITAVLAAAAHTGTAWIALALLLTFTAAALSMRHAGRRIQ